MIVKTGQGVDIKKKSLTRGSPWRSQKSTLLAIFWSPHCKNSTETEEFRLKHQEFMGKHLISGNHFHNYLLSSQQGLFSFVSTRSKLLWLHNSSKRFNLVKIISLLIDLAFNSSQTYFGPNASVQVNSMKICRKRWQAFSCLWLEGTRFFGGSRQFRSKYKLTCPQRNLSLHQWRKLFGTLEKIGGFVIGVLNLLMWSC
jgi:hypothetical protein